MLGDPGPVVRPAGENVPRIWAAGVTGSDLVRTVGNLKYHGVRGLAWPLAIHMAHALPPEMPSCRLVPVPLHRRRRRIRGFNQAELLARLVGRIRTMEVTDRHLVRRRATKQQARLTDDEQRRANLADAFSWRGPEPTYPVVIVDDIVTSGATVRAAAGAIRRAGGQVLGVLALGLAAGDR
jgi:ComF family protein